MAVRMREAELYVPVFTDLPGHEKTLDLSRRLGLPEPYVIGHLVSMWLWALRNRPSGIFLRSEDWLVRKAMGYRCPTDGRPIGGAITKRSVSDRTLMTHMIGAGWLDVLKGGDGGTRVTIHDWERYVGWLRRVQEARAGHPTLEVEGAIAERSPSDARPIGSPTMNEGPGNVDRGSGNRGGEEPIERPPSVKGGSNSALLVAAWNRNPTSFPITPDKGVRFVDAVLAQARDDAERRAKLAQAIEVAFYDQKRCAGKKIYEVLREFEVQGQGAKHGTGTPREHGLQTGALEKLVAERRAREAGGPDAR